MYIFHVFEMVLVSFHAFFVMNSGQLCMLNFISNTEFNLSSGSQSKPQHYEWKETGLVPTPAKLVLGCHDGKHREDFLSVDKE